MLSLVKSLWVRPQTRLRARPICGCRRHPQCEPRSTFRLELCQPMASTLPIMRAETSVGRRFWGSSRASRSLPVPMHLRYRDQSTRVPSRPQFEA